MEVSLIRVIIRELFNILTCLYWDSVDDTATRYRVDDSGFKPRWGKRIYLLHTPLDGP
jgi:hypothetical protein